MSIFNHRRGTDGLEGATRRFVRRYMRGRKPRRLHLSTESLSLAKFKNFPQATDHKPKGMWYGFNNSWIDWCLSEQPNWLCPYIYEVTLHESKVLRITNVEEFEQFEDTHHDIPEYRKEPARMQGGCDLLSLEDLMMPNGYRMRFHDYMNYGKVAQAGYGAMEITPYLWEKRLESMWYYGWDCASGCVWDIQAVADLRLFALYDQETDEFLKVSLQKEETKV